MGATSNFRMLSILYNSHFQSDYDLIISLSLYPRRSALGERPHLGVRSSLRDNAGNIDFLHPCLGRFFDEVFVGMFDRRLSRRAERKKRGRNYGRETK